MAMKSFFDRKLLEEEKKISKILEQVCLKADIKLDSQGFPIGLNHHPFNHPLTANAEVQTDPQPHFIGAGSGQLSNEIRDYLNSHHHLRGNDLEDGSLDQSQFENSVSSSKNWEEMLIEQLAKENEYIILTKDAEIAQLKADLQEMEENLIRLIKWRNSTVNYSSYLLSSFEKKYFRSEEDLSLRNSFKSTDISKLFQQLKLPLQEDPQLSPKFAKYLMNQVIISNNPQLKEETIIALEVARQTTFSPLSSPLKVTTEVTDPISSYNLAEKTKSDSSLSRLFPAAELQDDDEEKEEEGFNDRSNSSSTPLIRKSFTEATNFVPFGGQVRAPPPTPPPPRPPVHVATTPLARPPPPPRPPNSSGTSSQEMKSPQRLSSPPLSLSSTSPKTGITVDDEDQTKPNALSSPSPSLSTSQIPPSPTPTLSSSANKPPSCIKCQQHLLQIDLPFHEMTIHELYPYLTPNREYPLLKLFYLLSLMQYFHNSNSNGYSSSSHPLQRQQELEQFQFYTLANIIQPPRHLQSQVVTGIEMEKKKKQLLQMSTITKNVMLLFFFAFDLIDEKCTIKKCQDLWELGVLMASRKSGKPRLKLNYSDFVFLILQFVQVKYLTMPSSTTKSQAAKSATRRMSTARKGSVSYQHSSEDAIIGCMDKFLQEIGPILDHFLMNPKDFDQVMTLYWDLPHDELLPLLAEHQELLYNNFKRTKSYGIYYPEQHPFSLRDLVGGTFTSFENYCINYQICPQLLPLSMVRLISQTVRRITGNENTSFYFFNLYSVILYAARHQASAHKSSEESGQKKTNKLNREQKRLTEKLINVDKSTPLAGKVPPLPITLMKAIFQVFIRYESIFSFA